ncbi:hypothetical protein [Minwuia thermotolerans]|uniref:Terminase small subunit n=1 Tax=Minwuia thermotolerans TaxID=2056226 RepID=A0A2M9G2M9_9PROT|nr:hypothetical protein [Minwuia thermotolerans]PJK29944.1 hypothetical protein CVT23_09250 [Minwuia thermotolerans]
MAPVTQAGYAETRGVTRQYINKLTKEGRLRTIGPRKMIDPAEADQVLGYATEAAPDEEAPPAAAPVLDPDPEPGPSPRPAPATPADSAGMNYTRARAATETFRAKQAELELKQRMGQLLPRDMVVEAMSEAGVRIARHLDRLVRDADEIAEVAGRGGAREVRQMLRQKVRQLRAEIAAEITLTDEPGGE